VTKSDAIFPVDPGHIIGKRKVLKVKSEKNNQQKHAQVDPNEHTKRKWKVAV
jgi:hypothetical protein